MKEVIKMKNNDNNLNQNSGYANNATLESNTISNNNTNLVANNNEKNISKCIEYNTFCIFTC